MGLTLTFDVGLVLEVALVAEVLECVCASGRRGRAARELRACELRDRVGLSGCVVCVGDSVDECVDGVCEAGARAGPEARGGATTGVCVRARRLRGLEGATRTGGRVFAAAAGEEGRDRGCVSACCVDEGEGLAWVSEARRRMEGCWVGSAEGEAGRGMAVCRGEVAVRGDWPVAVRACGCVGVAADAGARRGRKEVAMRGLGVGMRVGWGAEAAADRADTVRASGER